MLLLEFLKILLSLFVFYIIGKLIITPFRKDENRSFLYVTFINTLIGLVSFTTVFAISKTNFNTILWGFPLIGIVYLIFEKLKPKSACFKCFFSIDDLKSIGVVAVLSFLFFLIPAFLYYDTPFNNMPHGDYYFYSKLINSMIKNGVESSIFLTHPFFEGNAGAAPYHYLVMWLAGAFVSIFKTLPIDAIAVYVNVVLNTILALGTFALANSLSTSKFSYVIALLGLFFSGILSVEFISQTETFIDFGAAFTPKYSIISIFYLLFIIKVIEKDDFYYLPLLFLPVVNIAMAPPVFTAVGLFLLIEFFNYREFKKFVLKLIPLFMLAIFIAGFYFLQPSNFKNPFNLGNIVEVHSIMPLKSIQVFVGALFILPLLYFWYFIPSLTLVKWRKIIEYFKSNKAGRVLFLFFAIVFVSSSAIWGVLHPMSDSIQFYYLSSYLLLNLLVIVLLINLHDRLSNLRKNIFYLFFVLIIGVNLYQIPTKAFFRYTAITSAYSEEYIKEISTIFNSPNFNKTGVFIKSNNEIKTAFQANPYWISRPPLDHFIADFNLINIGVNDYKVVSNDIILKLRAENGIRNAPFNLFIEEQNTNLTSDEYRIKFIQDFDIDYLICQKGVEAPENLIFKKLIVDELSGESFYLLK